MFFVGAFDIVSEFLPHVSIILYRVYPTSHIFLAKVFRLAFITTLVGTTAETILTMYLFGSLWNRWTIAFKVTTPMLHALFASAQLWGSWNFWKMYQKQRRMVAMKEDGYDPETGVKGDQNKDSMTLEENKDSVTLTTRVLPSRSGSEAESQRELVIGTSSSK